MRNLGIKYQILLVTLIPVLLIDIFFTWSHITRSIDQANELLRSKGLIIARQIAGASEFNLFSGNDSQIQYLLEQSVGSDDIVLASVYDKQGNLIAESASASFSRSDTTDYVYFRQAILSQGVVYSDVFTPDTGDVQHSSVLGWVNLYISRQHLRQKTLQIISESIVFFISILIMAVILTIVIGRRITQPIFRLMEHLKLVETGQLGKVIEPTELNEIGALQKGFNRMTHALLANRRHLNRRIQQATQQLNEAITGLESKNRELGFARDLAQDANRTKSEFLANMSHEIRTPINGIKGFISLLSQSRLDSSQQRYVDIILKSTNDLTSIINEILDFSKMESGKLHIVDEEFDLYEVIEQTRDILFINVLAKNIDLNLIIFSDTPRRVTGDKLRLKQILLNLIGNAIKFTDQGRVVVRVCLEDLDDEGASVGITVEDSGIGISEADQQSLFQAFSQVESSDTRRYSGTGLGLVISKNLARLMGGDISMQSTEGKGSKFSLVLPFGPSGRNDNARENVAAPVTALIFASEQNCLMEIRTLFERAGADTECELIDSSQDSEAVLRSIQRAIAWVDFLVFDLRHLEPGLETLLNHDITRNTRVILMHYDPDVEIPLKLDGIEFVSIINAGRKIAQIVSRQIPVDGQTDTVAEPAVTQSKKVLLVDDNPINLKLGSELIQLWGHEVYEADHGEKAFEVYQRESFDLVILDIQMPGIDGVSLLQMMREYKPEDNTPMVALTANVLNREADRLLELGFDYFLGKPIDESKFRALLDGKPLRRTASSESSPEPASPECSVDYAGSLTLCADNRSLLKQIMEILRRDIPDQRRQLADAFAELDYDRLGALAHKLQGVTCYASLPRLKRLVAGLQRQLAGNAGTPLEPLMRELDEELKTIDASVAEHLEGLAGSPAEGQDSSTTIATT
ncbi:MAG: response regulator [Gammaproteobacteria bacterium]|nr:response regulator [Gammaproteobacteria bacterium]